MRECETSYETKMGSGRRGDQINRSNSGYGRRFHQNWLQTTKSIQDIEESNCGEDQGIIKTIERYRAENHEGGLGTTKR